MRTIRQHHHIFFLLLLLVAGCGDPSETVDRAKEMTSKAGHAIGEEAGTLFSSITAGYEKSVTAYDVRVAKELQSRGVTVSVAKQSEGSATNILSLYIINRLPVSGTLRIKLLNIATQEIGRATAAVSLPADNARYVPFAIDREVPLPLTRLIELDLKKE